MPFGAMALLPDTESVEYDYTPVKKKPGGKKKTKKAITGYIYFLKEEGTDYYKCGKTTRSPAARVEDLATGNPRPLILLTFIRSSNIRSVEQFCHYGLKRYHYRNEWYRMNENQAQAFIQWLQQLHEPLR